LLELVNLSFCSTIVFDLLLCVGHYQQVVLLIDPWRILLERCSKGCWQGWVKHGDFLVNKDLVFVVEDTHVVLLREEVDKVLYLKDGCEVHVLVLIILHELECAIWLLYMLPNLHHLSLT